MADFNTTKVGALSVQSEVLLADDFERYLNSKSLAGIDTTYMNDGDYVHYDTETKKFKSYSLMKNDVYICQTNDEIDLCKNAINKHDIILIDGMGTIVERYKYDNKQDVWTTSEDVTISPGQQSYNPMTESLFFCVDKNNIKSLKIPGTSTLNDLNDFLNKITEEI